MTEGPKKRATLKTWLLRLALMITAPLVLLALVELVWQVVGDPRFDENERFLATRPPHFGLAKLGMLRDDPDPEISFTLRPGFDDTVAGKLYRVNEFGLRGGPVNAKKAPDAKRVLVLGDSYAFGFGVAEQDTISAQLERRLGVECLNMGVPGYQTGQEAALLERDGLELEPDVVVLVYYGNDCVTSNFLYDPRVKGVYNDELGLPIGLKKLLARSIVYSRIAKGYTGYLTRRKHYESSSHWTVTRDRLEHIRRMLEQRGVGFVLVAIPLLDNSTDFANKDHKNNVAHDKVLAFAKEERVATVDARAELMAVCAPPGGPIRPVETLFVVPALPPRPSTERDSHLTGEGYGILVDAIARRIRERKMLE